MIRLELSLAYSEITCLLAVTIAIVDLFEVGGAHHARFCRPGQ